jgi:hypothetical protein
MQFATASLCRLFKQRIPSRSCMAVRTARELGIEVPPAVLSIVDEVIE